jgi:hypothetical protein
MRWVGSKWGPFPTGSDLAANAHAFVLRALIDVARGV